jgi:hypothetical protein
LAINSCHNHLNGYKQAINNEQVGDKEQASDIEPQSGTGPKIALARKND